MSEVPTLKIAVILQARMNSERLPGKPLLKVLNRPLLSYMVERLQRIEHPVTLVIATTETSEPIIQFCKTERLNYYVGSEKDVLDRYLKTARRYEADVIVRVTGDNPLLDPQVIDEAIRQFLEAYPALDYLSNSLQRTFPRGMDVEIFKRRALEMAHEDGFRSEEREHVTPYIWRHPELFQLAQMTYKRDASQHRWTVDTQEDFELIKRILEAIYPRKKAFTLEDLLELLEENPDWSLLNASIQQKSV